MKFKNWHKIAITGALIASVAVSSKYHQTSVKTQDLANPAVVEAGYYPDRTKTTGKLGNVPIGDICKNGTGKYRNVPDSEKKEIAKEYGLPFPTPNVEYDHWYPLGISGSNDKENLWPMPAPQFHQKDVVEAYLNRKVCNNEMSVAQAVQTIDNWYPFYQKNFKDKLGSISEKIVE